MAGLLSPGDPIYRAQGCPDCQDQGYIGRTGVYEVVQITRTLQSLIHEGASEQDLITQARLDGPSLLQDGRRLVTEGDTTVEEIARVAREDG
jgi:general secretion pathway protein E